MSLINNGRSVNIWHGITSGALLSRCSKATEPEREAMALVAGLMDAREPITEYDWKRAEDAFRASGVRVGLMTYRSAYEPRSVSIKYV